LAILIVAIASGISAWPALGGMLFGAGTISCAEWQKYRASDDRPHSYQAQAWVDGYLFGYNSALDKLDILASQLSPIPLYAWIDNYCTAHPLDRLATSAWELKKELTARAKESGQR
jgi:hypothetical protein